MALTHRDLEICYALAREAEDMAQRLARLKAYAMRTTASMDAAAHGGDISDRVGEGVAAYLDLEAEAGRKIAGFIAHIRFVEEAIEALDDSTQRRLLRLRYIDGRTWEQIGEAMSYSRMQLNRLHRRALDIITTG